MALPNYSMTARFMRHLHALELLLKALRKTQGTTKPYKYVAAYHKALRKCQPPVEKTMREARLAAKAVKNALGLGQVHLIHRAAGVSTADRVRVGIPEITLWSASQDANDFVGKLQEVVTGHDSVRDYVTRGAAAKTELLKFFDALGTHNPQGFPDNIKLFSALDNIRHLMQKLDLSKTTHVAAFDLVSEFIHMATTHLKPYENKPKDVDNPPASSFWPSSYITSSSSSSSSGGG